MKTFMFPGQGSQSRGMGGTLFDEFKELTDKADKILGYSIKELCLEDPRRELNQTQFTQPALYVVNALSYFKKIEESEQKPDFVVGHSLGEFNALLAAECFDFEVGLKLVKKRGELMSEATGGGMAAILNATKEEIETVLKENELSDIDLANFNTPSQIVISGLKDEIGKAQSFFQEGAMKYFPLNTSGAFHSRYMQSSRKKFETYLKKFKFADLKIPVISNVSAKPYQNDEVIENLSNQITSSVKWSESIQYLMELGERKAEGPVQHSGPADSMEFEEIGHGEVLTKLVDKIRTETSKPLNSGIPDRAGESRLTESEEPSGSDLSRGGPPHEQDELKRLREENLRLREKLRDHIQDSEVESQNVELHPIEVEEPDESGLSSGDDSQEQEAEGPTEGRSTEGRPTEGRPIEDDSIKNLNETPKNFPEAEEKVAAWNKNYPIGTKVKSSIMDDDDLETRTVALVLFGHRAAVYMKGYNGYFDLDEITPL